MLVCFGYNEIPAQGRKDRKKVLVVIPVLSVPLSADRPESKAPDYDPLQAITILNDKTSKISQFGENYSKFAHEEFQKPDRLDAEKKEGTKTKKIIPKNCY